MFSLNPFIIYISSFGVTLLIYLLGWSTLYPDLSFDLLAFLLLTFLASILFSRVFSRNVKRIVEEKYLSSAPRPALLLILLCGFLLELAMEGSVPLFQVINGLPYDYTGFGIPTFHVFIITFSSAISTIRFCDFLYANEKKYKILFLIEAILPILFDLMIINRGGLLITLLSWAFCYVAKTKRIDFKKAATIAVLTIASIYGFGIVGNLRTDADQESDIILTIGQASQKFKDAGIPNSFFWGYVYLSSPLANLQNTINDSNLHSRDPVAEFIIGELLPDFVSKRLWDVFEINKSSVTRVTEELTASTIYTRSYASLGWPGPAFMYLALSTLIGLYVFAIKNNPFKLPALALLNTLVFFCIFDNMIAFTGMIGQLFWPLVMPLFLSKKSPASGVI